MPLKNITTEYVDLGHGSYSSRGITVLEEQPQTPETKAVYTRISEWSAFTCNCSEEAILAREAEWQEDWYEDPEELDYRLTHPQLVDEYLKAYSNDETDLNFDNWLEEQMTDNPEWPIPDPLWPTRWTEEQLEQFHRDPNTFRQYYLNEPAPPTEEDTEAWEREEAEQQAYTERCFRRWIFRNEAL